ncbi:MAG: metal-sensitive transcriptional regulator [Patescibacteria group bacterium]|nr:MAG: metal-sensitive transcriptional regulator [Patescibacteria group bacterium]
MSDKNIKKRATHRVKIILGQANGLLKAIEKNKYCIDVLNQSFSIQESLKSLDALFLENHLNDCVKKSINKKGESKKTIDELLKIYKLARKSK